MTCGRGSSSGDVRSAVWLMDSDVTDGGGVGISGNAALSGIRPAIWSDVVVRTVLTVVKLPVLSLLSWHRLWINPARWSRERHRFTELALNVQHSASTSIRG
ncbi:MULTISPECIES: hypothetical protein [Acidithiobacillus]|uniref:Uncharacterized protein n=1 Tax=Acidithiobacillus ferriphilus TaxID=1689834 RepID=A0ABU6FS10_9PROT|nr:MULTISPECIES: hypothetical protein [Acidithiobacillus]MEB8475566.1 hypothetical protein [Acidithiobacillus ferriphilus]MEB8487430.1 hypothetical protein [Acidithiobacillus ferriphilus]MEB8491405.1 hypothetical protein [Acidithiobacillus ferriphilus]MEB8493245.1 hypothetical protein [Acidithiobacillus ferriphilus]MEB8514865.1 hypothetical protein [Acidithiobacillus ferriphilus]